MGFASSTTSSETEAEAEAECRWILPTAIRGTRAAPHEIGGDCVTEPFDLVTLLDDEAMVVDRLGNIERDVDVVLHRLVIGGRMTTISFLNSGSSPPRHSGTDLGGGERTAAWGN